MYQVNQNVITQVCVVDNIRQSEVAFLSKIILDHLPYLLVLWQHYQELCAMQQGEIPTP